LTAKKMRNTTCHGVRRCRRKATAMCFEDRRGLIGDKTDANAPCLVVYKGLKKVRA